MKIASLGELLPGTNSRNMLGAMFVCPECGSSAREPGACEADRIDRVPRNDPLLGVSVGSYRIARKIGQGGMGQVYRAVQPAIGSRVAIKVLSQECAAQRELVERFFAEARAVNMIRHEHIVNVLDLALFPDGRPYIVMEYLEGRPLSALIQEHGPAPLAVACAILREVLSALEAAHAKGIVHRDLKPDNIFVSPAGHAKVLDFGIAKLQPNVAEVQAGTRTGSLLGTPHYMSPEQALGRSVDARSDLYSIGVILYESLTGRRPFDAPSLYELLRQQVEADPPAPSTLRPDLPLGMQAVIARALAKDPRQRYQSAREFAHAIETGTPALSSIESDIRSNNAAPQQWSAPSLATAIRAPGRSAVSPVTPGSYVQDQSIAKSAKSRGSMATALAVGCLGVGALGALTTGALLFFGRGTQSEENSGVALPGQETTTTERNEPSEPEPEPAAAALNLAQPQLDLSAFHVGGFLPRATEMAKQHFQDAQFVRLDATGINKHGVIDFTAQSSSNVLYRFRSPSASVPPKGFPENAEFESNCMVYVMVSQNGVMSHIVDKWSCDMPIVGLPKCTPEQVWSEAERRGAPTGNLIGTLWYAEGPDGKGRWNVTIPPSFSSFLPDAC